MSIDEQTKRIAQIFDKTTDGKLPNVTEKSLLTYYLFLNKQVTFPIAASLNGTDITITNLYPIDDLEDIDRHYGLICEGKRVRKRIQISLAEVDVTEKTKNQQLIEDYQTWFWENR